MTRAKLPVAVATLVLAGTLAVAMAQAAPASPPDDHWAPTRQWMSFRAGSARISGNNVPDGGFGVGVEYSRMLTQLKLYKWSVLKRWSLGGAVSYENLGSFADATQISVPATLTLARHFRMTPTLHPYFGPGFGAIYRKLYRTGDDMSTITPSFILVSGLNVPIDNRQLVGLDWRVNFYDGSNGSDNPVFGPGEKKTRMWSLKLNYALTYF